MKLRTAALPLLLSVAGCQRDQPPPQYGYYRGPSPPPYGYQYPPVNPPPAPPTLAAAVGQALTPFGVLLQSLPPLPAQLPPLPSLAELLQSWPFPWNPPNAQPPPVQPPPIQPPPPGGNWPAAWVAFEDDVLRETNKWRAYGAVCGGKPFPPVGPVGPHPQLRNAARGHSSDMARRDYFDHDTPEGVGPMQRAKSAGYPGGFVGENIAAGQRTPREVVKAWIDSPGHCLNIMEPRYVYLGVGYLFEQGDQFGDFWTQNFGG
jgi:uncharacterized protein YkwD